MGLIQCQRIGYRSYSCTLEKQLESSAFPCNHKKSPMCAPPLLSNTTWIPVSSADPEICVNELHPMYRTISILPCHTLGQDGYLSKIRVWNWKENILTKLLNKIMPSTSKGELVPKFITYLAPRCSWFISIIYLPWSKMLTQMSLSKFEKRCCFSCTSCLPLSSNMRWKN